jgi:transcriptional regulator with XRE-family HTH domain
VSETLDTRGSVGLVARRIRISEHLTQEELAGLAHVSREDVESLEGSLPLRLDVKLKLLKELWSRKASQR